MDMGGCEDGNIFSMFRFVLHVVVGALSWRKNDIGWGRGAVAFATTFGVGVVV